MNDMAKKKIGEYKTFELRGKRVKVLLHNGSEFEGTYDVHPITCDPCVRNDHNFPIAFKNCWK